jgi:hypothetical protein
MSTESRKILAFSVFIFLLASTAFALGYFANDQITRATITIEKDSANW